MVSHRLTALLIVISVLLITEVKWHYEQGQQLQQLREDIERIAGALIARETDIERLGALVRGSVNTCEKKRISKLADISECKESIDKYDPTITTTPTIIGKKLLIYNDLLEYNSSIGTNNKQIYLQQLIRRSQVELDSCYLNTSRSEREYKACDSSKLNKEDTNSSTDNTPLQRISSFLLFLGYARSGHSIVAALLDAHPHVVISHELHAVQRWAEYYSLYGRANRDGLFSEIIENAESNLNGAKGFRSPNSTQKYYTLDVPGLYQGRYEDYIQVIGDKKGGSLVSMYKGTDEDFQELEKFQNFVGYPLRIIHIVRNPYDNIATKFLYGVSGEARKDAIEEDALIESEETDINVYVKRHLSAFQKVQRFIEYFGNRMITLHHEDLIENPIQFLTTLCNYLVITCSNQYLEKASEVVFSSVSKSRYNVKWSQETRYKIESAIERYSFLNRYSYGD